MQKKPTDPMLDAARPVKLTSPPRVCEKCGNKYIPTGRNQKLCQDCREGRESKSTKASQSGPVTTYYIDPPKGIPAEVSNEPKMELKQEPEKTDPVVPEEEPMSEAPAEEEPWYEAKITRGGVLLIEAKIRRDLLEMILKEVR